MEVFTMQREFYRKFVSFFQILKNPPIFYEVFMQIRPGFDIPAV